MGTILDRIIAEKKKEVRVLKEIMDTPIRATYNRKSFIEILEHASVISIIAEFKRASPSKGDLNLHVDPKVQAKMYVDAGADAVSVLTDRGFFKGSITDLEEVRSVLEQPILCKDFIIDKVQIDAAKHAGADIILLIAAALDDKQLSDLYEYALQKDLEVLMEVHDVGEASRVLRTNNRLIGVNNRNLKTFEVDLAITEQLAPMLKKEDRFLISESGLKTMEDVDRVAKAGADGILVGETFMTHANPAAAISQMRLPLVEVSS